MKLSIIIITYNSAPALRLSLTSALGLRSNHDLEILVVDDGSTDNTAELMDRVCTQFSQARYIRCTENRGRAAVRNSGLDEATGDYLCFLDSDDYLLASAMDAIEEALTYTPDIVVAGRLDFDAKTKARRAKSANDQIYNGVVRIRDCDQYPAIYNDNFITGKFIRRQFLIDNEISFDATRRNAEDIGFATDIFRHATCVRIVPEPFYFYAQGGYKANFSASKGRDVLMNTNKIARLAATATKGATREALSSKVATILHELFRRADGVLAEDVVLEIFQECVDTDTLNKIGRPRFASPKARSVLKFVQSGNFAEAQRNAL